MRSVSCIRGVTTTLTLLSAITLSACSIRAQDASNSPSTTVAAKLVRCVANGESQCLEVQTHVPAYLLTGIDSASAARATTSNGVTTLVFAAPVLPATSLARTAWRGVANVSRDTSMQLLVNYQWRPPLFALPAYFGVAEQSIVPAEIREALNTGSAIASVRMLIAIVLALAGFALRTFVPRLFWRGQSETPADVARRAAYYRGHASTQEILVLRGPAPREGAPRKPHEPTVQNEVLRRTRS